MLYLFNASTRNKTGENILLHWEVQPYKKKKCLKLCRFQTLLCTRSIKADPSPSRVYGRLVRSAASMAALTFSLASSETKRVPLASTEQPKNKRDLSPPDRVVWDVFLLPLATRKTFVVSPSSPVYTVCESLSAPSFFSQQTPAQGAERPAGDSVESQANTGLAWQTSHLLVCMGTSGPSRLTGPSVCLPIWLSAYTYCWYVLVLLLHQNFYSYTGTRLIYKNKSQQYQSKQAKCYITTTAPFCDYLITDLAPLCAHEFCAVTGNVWMSKLENLWTKYLFYPWTSFWWIMVTFSVSTGLGIEPSVCLVQTDTFY